MALVLLSLLLAPKITVVSLVADRTVHVERELIGEKIAVYQIVDGAKTSYIFSRTEQAYYLENGVKEFDQTTNYFMRRPQVTLMGGFLSLAYEASFAGSKDETANKKLIGKFLMSSIKQLNKALLLPYSYPDKEGYFYLGLSGEPYVDRQVGHYAVFKRQAFVNFRNKLLDFDKNFIVELELD
jgi:hypothetical protein